MANSQGRLSQIVGGQARTRAPKRSRMRTLGWPMILGGLGMAVLGLVLTVAGLNDPYGSPVLGIVLTAIGVAAGNLGVAFLMLGIIEERVLDVEDIVRNGFRWMVERETPASDDR